MEGNIADHLKNRGVADRDRVNVNEDWEVRYWMGKFSCSDEELKIAAKAVGPMEDDVERELCRWAILPRS